MRLTRRAAAKTFFSTALVVCVAYVAATTATIDPIACELLRPGVYRIEFTPPAASGPVAIYASTSPDAIDRPQPVVSDAHFPVDITIPGDRQATGTGSASRIYFHLKPTNGRARVTAVRRLPLEGAVNFRDVGGYPTNDGRFVRWGVVYRSEQLADLTANDYADLNRLGVRLECDLRTPGERGRKPTRWQGATPEVLYAPILRDADLPATPAALPKEVFLKRLAEAQSGSGAQLGGSYDRFVSEFVDSYAQVFHGIARGTGASVTHCTAGRDRTGVFSAVLLTALGVPWDVVVEDYLLTDRYRLTDADVERTRREYQQQYGLDELPPAAAVRAMRALHASTMERTFATIGRTYGSFDGFVRNGLKMTPEDLRALKARLLTD
jgi:protein-tyrosine phosphatase